MNYISIRVFHVNSFPCQKKDFNKIRNVSTELWRCMCVRLAISKDICRFLLWSSVNSVWMFFLIYTVNKSSRSRRFRYFRARRKHWKEMRNKKYHQNQFINMNVIKLKIEISYWIHSVSCIFAVAVVVATAVVVILLLLFPIRDAPQRARARPRSTRRRRSMQWS